MSPHNQRRCLLWAVLALWFACALIGYHLTRELPPPPKPAPGLVDPPAVSWVCDVSMNCFDCHGWAYGNEPRE